MTGNNNINEEIIHFSNHIESIRDILSLTMYMVQNLDKTAKKELNDFKKEYTSTIDEDDRKRYFTVDPDHLHTWKKLSYREKNTRIGSDVLPKSLFVHMVSQYDAFIGSLYKNLINIKPEIINNSEREYKYSDVIMYDDIEAFKGHVIDKEVETLLRKSHVDQIEYLEKKMKVNLTTDLKIFPQFVELTERRNLFVHCEGKASKHYFDQAKKYEYDVSDGVEIGSKLEVSGKYFKDSCECLYELGFKLGQVLWRKLCPSDVNQANDNLNSITFDLIERKQYELACKIIDFACETKSFNNQIDEKTSLVLQINRAQAHKWAGRKDKCVEIIDDIDWGAKASEFRLGANVLLEKWDQAIACMKEIGDQEHYMIRKQSYKQWPLFKELRKQDQFIRAYKDIYGEKFEIDLPNEKTVYNA